MISGDGGGGGGGGDDGIGRGWARGGCVVMAVRACACAGGRLCARGGWRTHSRVAGGYVPMVRALAPQRVNSSG